MHACHCGKYSGLVKMSANWLAVANADQLHVAIPNHLVREVLPDVNVLSALPPADDVVSPLNARSVVLVHRGWTRLSKAHVLEEAKVQDLRRRRRRRIVLRFCRG